ncbi:helix-turn-helix domain-containing protein [Mesorhizobium sp. dw_380]|uniref:helix-turn-helix domain-containing protein n=1 Tax=Mesorhizobium sp. dw_380 TaxID=2812001 RepID=UPI001BDE8E00|nr:helix-turn-helix domain-containing protein [Mesorhizobium sp. dw_380]
MAPAKETFSPVPCRVMGDKTLTREDLRVLIALAAHDRFGANGIGCYASHPRLAGLVGCHLKALSRSLSILAEKKYLTAKQHPLNRRLRVYSVVYTEFDALYLKAGIGSEPATYDDTKGSEPVTYHQPTGSSTVTEIGPIGSGDFEKTEQDQSLPEVNILGETYNRSRETILIDPVETASSTKAPFEKGARKAANTTSVGAMLAMVERSLKNGGDTSRLRYWLTWLDGLVGERATLDNKDQNYGRACRLFEEIGGTLDAA